MFTPIVYSDQKSPYAAELDSFYHNVAIDDLQQHFTVRGEIKYGDSTKLGWYSVGVRPSTKWGTQLAVWGRFTKGTTMGLTGSGEGVSMRNYIADLDEPKDLGKLVAQVG